MSGIEVMEGAHRPLRILVVAPMAPDPAGRGAIPIVLDAELAGLARRHEVGLVAVAEPGGDGVEISRRLREKGIDAHIVARPTAVGRRRMRRRLRMAATWLRGRCPWRTIWFAEPRAQAVLDSLVATRRPDAIVVEDNSMAALRYPQHMPLVLTEHEVRTARPIDWRAIRSGGLLRWAFREADWRRWPRYQVAVWERFDRVQVFTARDAERVAALAPRLVRRVRITPFGIALPPQADPAHEESGAILFVGNFTHAPNVDAAAWIVNEIMPRLRPRVPNVRLRLVGAEPPEEVRRLAAPDVEVTGSVPDVEGFFAHGALLLAPLRIGGGMRMKVLEGMARGKAVVTTSRGAAGLDAIGIEPPLVVAEEAGGLADAAAALLADPVARRELGRRARDFVAEHFSEEGYADRIEATCAELIAGREPVARGG
jgi:glycosyltransferase involved in cell wall biosynthesis